MTDNLPGVFPVAQDDKPKISNQPQDPMVGGGMAKEQMESAPIPHTETAPIVELKEDERVPEAVENWIEKLEHGEEIKLPQPVTDDDQVLVANIHHVDEEKIILPLTETQAQEGIQKKVYNSARWLAEWCVRVAKKLQGHVVYRTQLTEKESHGTT